MIPRERLISIARRVYRSYGYSPIDTPALEYLEVLAGKGGEESDKQLYQFEDHGKRKVGMRFDLTVPFARFAAQHINELGTPFKRYHIAPVWRGENTQRGRYREFVQCDFDVIGTRSIASDIETVLIIHDLFRAIGFDRFTIRLNNRQVLTGLLQQLDLAEQSVPILRALDKLAKIGPEKVAQEMAQTAKATESQAREVLRLASIAKEHDGNNGAILAELAKLVEGNETGEAGVAQLKETLETVAAAGVDPKYTALDVSIARGLDYYTGTVYETFLDDLPGIGSVCSGGRYDNLTGLFTKQELPGVGASLGLDRLLAAMEELDMIEKISTPAPIFMAYFDKDRLGDYCRIASQLRAAGLGVEIYPEPKKLGAQLKYADRRGHRLAIIAGGNEFEANVVQLKDLVTGDRQDIPLSDNAEELIAAIQKSLE